jgi:UDP-N-acetylmuramyl pentapeptide phosphotransferase/UDP-N-acetylglucosamine-1-phosphate transferase
MNELVFGLLVVSASAILVGVVRLFAIAHGVIDHPTDRGSHAVPTPRGGGLGVIATILVAFSFLADVTSHLRLYLCIAACVAVSLIGWLDDRRSLPIRTRLGVHLLGGLSVGLLSVGGDSSATLVTATFVLWSCWTVSSINFVNFMDGINGFVALQIAIFAASLAIFGWEQPGSSWYASAVAAACIGFLPWNFPRASIFLGDAGSGSLGFLVPIVALMTMREQSVTLFQSFLPLLPLFADAIVTIIRRWHRGEALTQAHRSHLYQRMANGGVGHTKVTLMFAAASVVCAIVAHNEFVANSWQLSAIFIALLLLAGTMLERRLKHKLV